MTDPTSDLVVALGLVEPAGELLPVSIYEAARKAAEFVLQADPPNTLRTWRAHWSAWIAYCQARGLPPVPIDPRELIVHLTQRSLLGAAPNTIRGALTALSVLDQRARMREGEHEPEPVRGAFIVRKWLKGWGKKNPRRPMRQAPSITTAQLDLVLQRAQERPPGVSAPAHVAMYARDRCMMLLGITGAFRISELVALDVADVRQQERGIAVLVRASKTDQAGEGREVGIMPQGRSLRCPIDAWHLWLGVRGNWSGPAFVPIERDGSTRRERISDSAARRLIQRRAKAAGLELVTSHSLRATFATIATEKGKAPAHIANQGRWSSLDTVRGYIRQGELFHDNPTAGLLDD